MTGSLVNYALTAGPSDVSLSLNLGGSPALLKMRAAKMSATIASATDVPAPPPSQLASGLTVFETVTANGTGQGLCGNITVDSLAQIPAPSVLTTGSTACVSCNGYHTYTYCGANNPVSDSCNSLLDVLVGGCGIGDIFGACLVTAVNPEQPDVPASGSVKTLTFSGNKIPASQTTGDEDAYSSYLTFTSNRAHFTGETCGATSDCQSGKTCTSGSCQ